VADDKGRDHADLVAVYRRRVRPEQPRTPRKCFGSRVSCLGRVRGELLARGCYDGMSSLPTGRHRHEPWAYNTVEELHANWPLPASQVAALAVYQFCVKTSDRHVPYLCTHYRNSIYSTCL